MKQALSPTFLFCTLAMCMALFAGCGPDTQAPGQGGTPVGGACVSAQECASGYCQEGMCTLGVVNRPDDMGTELDKGTTTEDQTSTEDTSQQQDMSSSQDMTRVEDMSSPDQNTTMDTTPDMPKEEDMMDMSSMQEDMAEDMSTPTTLDCSAFRTAGYSVCAERADACEIVFYDQTGCRDACAAAGMECAQSYRDDDSNMNAPQCAIHPSMESFNCAENNHRSDYCVCKPKQRAFPGAEGFGAFSEGGRGGTVYTVTNLRDSGQGSLRWAVERSGRRIVQFNVDGVIRLKSALRITDPYITIDGRGALDPGEKGITIRDYPIDIRTHNVIIRYLRVRLGDWAVLKRVKDAGLSRPRNSNDLDCINIDRAHNVILDHISASWSTDEIISVTNSTNITIQWSILSEPIGNRMTHPYGDNHAFCANNSAATLTYHHNLFAHFRFRGPQFEANDMRRSSPTFDAKFEAVNNVVYGYTSSGSRYRTGFEKSSDRISSVDFMYHFVGNRYVHYNSSRSEIMAHDSYGTENNIKAYFSGNIGPHRPNNNMDELSLVFTDSGGRDPIRRKSSVLSQVSTTPLFTSPAPVQVQSANAAYTSVLNDAGCSIERDAIDARILADVRANARPKTISSQEDVPGGWPSY